MHTPLPSVSAHAGEAAVPPAPVPAAQPSYAAVSWSAVAAGAVAAAALSFILLVLGVGLGLAAVSPWSYSSAPLGKAAIVWVSLMQLASSAVGGYMAGRLRVRWYGVHGDEVYFRDTAHGLLAWAGATLLAAALMAGAVRSALGGAVEVAAAPVGGMPAAAAAVLGAPPSAREGGQPDAPAAGATATAPPGRTSPGADALSTIARSAGAATGGGAGAGPVAQAPASGGLAHAYYADLLLRSDTMPLPDITGAALRAELVRLLDAYPGGLSDDDRLYVARMVAKRTGLEPSDAERRVDAVLAQRQQANHVAQANARAAADAARKAGAYSALWMFFALLLGAFSASLAATFGGRQRDLASPPRPY